MNLEDYSQTIKKMPSSTKKQGRQIKLEDLDDSCNISNWTLSDKRNKALTNKKNDWNTMYYLCKIYSIY